MFLSHKKLSLKVIEYEKQIDVYDKLVHSYVVSDSIKTLQVNRLLLHTSITEEMISKQQKEISKLQSKKTKATRWAVGGFTVSAGLLLTLLLK